MNRTKLVKIKNEIVSILPDFITSVIYKVISFCYKIGLSLVPYYFREDTMFYYINNLKKLGFKPDLIIDIGAYKGEWSLEVLKIYPDAQYILIEPQVSKKSLLESLSSKHENIRFYSSLVSSKPGIKKNFYEAETGSSIYKEKTKKDLNIKEYETETLDQIIQQVKGFNSLFLKLDVQGSELDILDGAKETLQISECILMEASLVEFNEGAPLISEVIDYMKENGFLLFDICDILRRKDNIAMQADLIFIRKDSSLYHRLEL